MASKPGVHIPAPVADRARLYVKSAAELGALHREFTGKLASGGGWVPLTFGVPGIDKVVQTMWPGTLTAVIARPSNWKTATLKHLARRECRRLMGAGLTNEQYVLFVSLEEHELLIAAEVTGAPASMVQIVAGDYDADELNAHFLSVADWPLWVGGYAWRRASFAGLKAADLPALTVEQIGREVAQVRIDNGLRPSAIFFDYIQIAASDKAIRSSDERMARVATVTYALKQLALELECPVVAASQAKQTVDEKPMPIPGLNDSEWGSVVGQHADVVLSLMYPDRYPNVIERHSNELTVKSGGAYPMRGSLVVTLVKQRLAEPFGQWVVAADPRTKTLAARHKLTCPRRMGNPLCNCGAGKDAAV